MQALVGLIVLGIVFILGPFLAPDAIGGARFVLVPLGTAITAFCTLALVLARLYRKPTANQAFVRTGMGSAQVILDVRACGGEDIDVRRDLFVHRLLDERCVKVPGIERGQHDFTSSSYEPAWAGLLRSAGG